VGVVKPWHFITLGLCTLVIVGIVVGAVLLARRRQ
jgi:hypothetical protein